MNDYKTTITPISLSLALFCISFIGLVFTLTFSYTGYDLPRISPNISRSISILGLIIGGVFIIFTLWAWFIPMIKFTILTNRNKAIVMSSFLLSANWFLCSLQYQIYLHEKDSYVLDACVSDEINNELKSLTLRMELSDSLKYTYTVLLNNINYDSMFVINRHTNVVRVNNESLKIKLIPCVFKQKDGKSSIVKICNSIVYFSNDDITLPHFLKSKKIRVKLAPSSFPSNIDQISDALRDTTSIISGEIIAKGIQERIVVLEEYKVYLNKYVDEVKQRGVSFTSFVFHNFESSLNNITPRNHLIKLVFYFQLLISLFIWGYITVVMYRVFDGKK